MVIGPLDAWLQTLVEVRAQHVEFDKQRVVYDHYRDKVSSLQDAKRKTQLKGKVFDKSSEEKLSRNMEKLKEAEGGYTDLRDRSVGRMLQVRTDTHARTGSSVCLAADRHKSIPPVVGVDASLSKVAPSGYFQHYFRSTYPCLPAGFPRCEAPAGRRVAARDAVRETGVR